MLRCRCVGHFLNWDDEIDYESTAIANEIDKFASNTCRIIFMQLTLTLLHSKKSLT
jgi:hypothetical protein